MPWPAWKSLGLESIFYNLLQRTSVDLHGTSVSVLRQQHLWLLVLQRHLGRVAH
jgi:hypothetical protein